MALVLCGLLAGFPPLLVGWFRKIKIFYPCESLLFLDKMRPRLSFLVGDPSFVLRSLHFFHVNGIKIF